MRKLIPLQIHSFFLLHTRIITDILGGCQSLLGMLRLQYIGVHYDLLLHSTGEDIMAHSAFPNFCP